MSEMQATYTTERSLPDDLPDHPWGIFREWWDLAHTAHHGGPVQPNPNAVCLATVAPNAHPSARILLVKGMDLDRGYIVVYSNRTSRKGRELATNPRAACVVHWDPLDVQVRIEGPVTESPDAESDAYFASRALESRLGAWGSLQSQPLESRERLIEQVAEKAIELGVRLDDPDAPVPRPPHWGGYRVWAERVELWCAGVGRVHDRAAWTRRLRDARVDGAAGFEAASPWSATRLNP